MRETSENHYECAFENWLIDGQADYVRADEHKRIGAAGQSVKNFDFLIYARSGRRVIVEVKGRTFHGTSLVGMKGLECWVMIPLTSSWAGRFLISCIQRIEHGSRALPNVGLRGSQFQGSTKRGCFEKMAQ